MLHLICQTRGDELSPWLLLIAAGTVLLLLLIVLAPLFRRGASSSTPPAVHREAGDPSLAQQRAVERDMQTLMHELSEMARKVGAQLDARAARLEQLMREADERVARAELAGHHTEAPAAHRSNGHPTSANDNGAAAGASATARVPAAALGSPEIDPQHV